MEQKNKIIVGGVILVLIILISVFLIMISSYTPPARPDEVNVCTSDACRQNINSQKINNEQLKATEMQPNSNQQSRDLAVKGNIRIKVVDQNNLSAADLICQLSIVTKEPNFMTSSILRKKTDSQGECYFYSIEPYRNYWVEFFNENDRMFHAVVEVNNLQPGNTFTKQITANINKAAAANNPSVQCDDTDGGMDYYVHGEVVGLQSLSTNTNQGKGSIIGENANACDFRYDSSFPYQISYDCCLDAKTSNQLNESYCDPGGYAYSTAYMCPKGCQGGACIK